MSSPSSGGASSAASAAHLSNSALNLTALREYYRAELSALLNLPSAGANSKEKKALVLDKTLSGPLGLVAEVALLQSHGVDQIHHLKDLELPTTAAHVMYLVRPVIANMRLIASHILNHRARDPRSRRTYSIFFVPRKSMLCEKELEVLGVLGDITHMEDFYLELIPFDEDVLSMEMPNAFKDTFLDGDPTSLLYIARSIMKMQSIFGIIPTIRGKGGNALKVFHLLQRLRREGGFDLAGGGTPLSTEIDSMIILDRSADLVTPLLTQLTYEGLIDELFGIKNSYIDVDAEMIGGNKPPPSPVGGAGPPPPQGPKKLLLNSVDSLFKETRDLNFRVLGPLLHRKAEYIKETYSERHSAQTVNEMHSFMQKFKEAHAEHNLLQTHINLAEKISAVFKSKLFDRKLEIERWCLEGIETDAVEEYIEACIAKNEPMVSVMRLMCLHSLTQGGLRQKKFDHFKREFLHTYGFSTLFTLNNLEKLGMFTSNSGLLANVGSNKGFASMRKGFRLLTPSEKVDVREPNDIAYTFNGYAPLSVRIIEAANRPGWRRVDELLAAAPGKAFEYRQEAAGVASQPLNLLDLKGSTAVAQDDRARAEPPQSPSGKERKKPLTLVCFLGGVTMAEISALRFLSEREDHGRDYIICTTKLVNGQTFVESIVENVTNNLNGGSAAAPPQAARAGSATAGRR